MSPEGVRIKPAAKKGPHAANQKAKKTKKASSPVSRYALLAVALILPFRRRTRRGPATL